ncbi:MAG: uroporphyrinogen-III synthase [Chitinophagaceae bacterium]|nr:MAG: uroporphyrinogen-III synthase [Chitinophagaceae bacterium]
MNKKITILSTRELDESLVDQILGKDVVFDQVPFIEMVPRDGEELKMQVNEFASQELLGIFTSRTAVDAVVSLLESKPDAWKIACMGGATKKNAEDFFGHDSVVLGSGSARELGEKLLALQTGVPIVFFAGNRRLNDLPDLLQKNAASLQEVVVYDTFETPVEVDTGYDAVLFFSPSAAQSFFSMNKVKETAVLFSIGETTASVLRGLSSNEVIVSPLHSPERLVETAFAHFGL